VAFSINLQQFLQEPHIDIPTLGLSQRAYIDFGIYIFIAMAALVKTAFPVSERMRELLNNHNIYVIRASSERMALGPRKRHGQFDDRPPSYRSLVGVLLPDKMYPELEGEDEEAEIARRDVIKLQGDIAGESHAIAYLSRRKQLTFS
jgi:hypothetical protein